MRICHDLSCTVQIQQSPSGVDHISTAINTAIRPLMFLTPTHCCLELPPLSPRGVLREGRPFGLTLPFPGSCTPQVKINSFVTMLPIPTPSVVHTIAWYSEATKHFGLVTWESHSAPSVPWFSCLDYMMLTSNGLPEENQIS